MEDKPVFRNCKGGEVIGALRLVLVNWREEFEYPEGMLCSTLPHKA